MVFTVELEKSVSGTCILGVVICKLRYWKEPGAIILFSIHKHSKVCFHCTVLLFGLAVNFWMEGGGELSFNAKEVTEQRPELGSEN